VICEMAYYLRYPILTPVGLRIGWPDLDRDFAGGASVGLLATYQIFTSHRRLYCFRVVELDRRVAWISGVVSEIFETLPAPVLDHLVLRSAVSVRWQFKREGPDASPWVGIHLR